MSFSKCLPKALLVVVAALWLGPVAEAGAEVLRLAPEVKERCLKVLRGGMRGEEFWPSIHAAEGLTLAGHGEEVRAYLGPKLAKETDDQQRCGLARELVRAGDRSKVSVMLDILGGEDVYGHVHAAESLFKVARVGDGRAMRRAFREQSSGPLRLMAAAALGRCGSPAAMQFLRKTLADEDPQVSRIAAWILGRIGDASDVARLRAGMASIDDPLSRAYFEHALAALGDEAGLLALERNLGSDDPAIRTYAATFVGDARATGLAEKLAALLDDPHLDARIRAAQSLLVLSRPSPRPRDEDVSVIAFEATGELPRYTEGSVVELNDGSLLYAVTQFGGSGSDFAKARIVARRSRDGGRTWGPLRVLQENTGDLNVMSVTLRRLASPAPEGTLAMFYLEKNAYDDLHVHVRFSRDEAKTFGEPRRVTTEPGYHVMNNDRVTQLSDGRLLAPVAWTKDVRKEDHFISFCYISDDGGKTWRRGKGQVDLPKRGAMEPGVVELADGRVLMILRSQLGTISASYSADRGETWSEPNSLDVKAPEAPATVRTVPATGDLLLVWNNTYTPGAGHGGQRTPLTAAISSDGGRTWKQIRNLETRGDRTYAYTSLAFVRDRAVLGYWDAARRRYSSRFRSLPVAWFYRQ